MGSIIKNIQSDDVIMQIKAIKCQLIVNRFGISRTLRVVLTLEGLLKIKTVRAEFAITIDYLTVINHTLFEPNFNPLNICIYITVCLLPK